MSLPDILEFLMILSFGISWPLKVYKSYKSRTAKGSSVTFTVCIALGYVCGIISKIIKISAGDISPWNPAFIMYWPNIIFVTTDICLYFRNKKLDAAAEQK
jgi:lipopolysaccharide export LptBFGC system permease protein LptF